MARDAFQMASDMAMRPGRGIDDQRVAWALAETNLAILDANQGAWRDAKVRLRHVMSIRPEFTKADQVWTWVSRSESSH